MRDEERKSSRKILLGKARVKFNAAEIGEYSEVEENEKQDKNRRLFKGPPPSNRSRRGSDASKSGATAVR